MKTSELTGAALDWAVADAQGYLDNDAISVEHFLDMREAGVHWTRGSIDWAEGGPIIERERISVWETCGNVDPQPWSAIIGIKTWGDEGDDERDESFGPTPLVAAMRCYVASKLGDEVEIPEEVMR